MILECARGSVRIYVALCNKYTVGTQNTVGTHGRTLFYLSYALLLTDKAAPILLSVLPSLTVSHSPLDLESFLDASQKVLPIVFYYSKTFKKGLILHSTSNH